MALLRWIHLRKLVPLSELIDGLEKGAPAPGRPRPCAAAAPPRPAAPAPPAPVPVRDRRRPARSDRRARPQPVARGRRTSPRREPSRRLPACPRRSRCRRPAQGRVPGRDPQGEEVLLRHGRRAGAEDRRRGRPRRLHVRAAAPRAREQLEQNRPWLEDDRRAAAGRKMTVVGREGAAPPPSRRAVAAPAPAPAEAASDKPATRSRRRWPTPASRRCSTFSRRDRRTSRRGRRMNIQQMMKQAQQMQERLQKQMAECASRRPPAAAWSPSSINGAKQVQSLKIDPEVVSKDDVEMLQDLILAAINDAHRKADEAMSQADGRDDGRHEDPRPVLMTLSRSAHPARSSSCSACPASAPRARSGWRSTSSRPRARRPSGSPTPCARSRSASPTARSAATSPTPIPCCFCTQPERATTASSASSRSRRTSAAIEKTRDFKGVYHVLMGALSPLQGVGPGRSEDQGAADARRRAAASRK